MKKLTNKSSKHSRLAILCLVVSMCMGAVVILSRNDGNSIPSEEGSEQGKNPSSAQYWNNFTFIHINGNWTDAVSLGWCKGDGSFSNPYTIENMTINATNSAIGGGIKIENSVSDYFLIQNCTIINNDEDGFYFGIEVYLSQRGCIKNNNISNINNGIIDFFSGNLTVDSNIVTECDEDYFTYYSENITITNNNFTGIVKIRGEDIALHNNNASSYYAYGDLSEISTYNISNTNLADGNPFYYYFNKTNLNHNNFSKAGQVSLAYCNNSVIKGLDIKAPIQLFNCFNSTISDNLLSHCSLDAIYNSKSTNITIYNNSISASKKGIYLSQNTDAYIINNSIHSESYGIELSYGLNHTIHNNTIISADGLIFSYNDPKHLMHNISLSNSLNGSMIYYYREIDDLNNNNFTDASQIFLVKCNNTGISNIKDPVCLSYPILAMACNNLTFEYLNFTSIEQDILKIERSNKVNLQNITMNDISGETIRITDCDNVEIMNCSLINVGKGIICVSGINATVKNNKIINSEFGLNIINDFAEIKNNEIRYCETGLDVGAMNVTVESNQIIHSGTNGLATSSSTKLYNGTIISNFILQSNGKGIDANSIKDCKILNNKIKHINGLGLDFYASDENTIINNDFFNISDRCAFFDPLSSNNIIYNNSFCSNNTDQVEDDGTGNSWYNGILGNFWCDYTDTDSNDDGIGDTLDYTIPGSAGSIDEYPIFWDAPVISLTSPGNYSIFNATEPTISISADEGIADEYFYTIDSDPTVYILGSSENQLDPTAWASIGNGSASLHFYVNDSRNYVDTFDLHISRDVIAPSITITLPNENEICNATAFASSRYDVVFADGNGVHSQFYMLSNASTNTDNYTWTGAIGQAVWDEIGNGTMTLHYFANDTLGNLRTATITLLKDIIAPGISFNPSMTNESTVDTLPGYNLTITEGNLEDVWYRIYNGTQWSEPYEISSLEASIDSTAWTNLDDGQFTVRFYANDTAENINYVDYVLTKDTSGTQQDPTEEEEEDDKKDEGNDEGDQDILTFLTSPAGLITVGAIGGIAIGIGVALKKKGGYSASEKEREKIDKIVNS